MRNSQKNKMNSRTEYLSSRVTSKQNQFSYETQELKCSFIFFRCVTYVGGK